MARYRKKPVEIEAWQYRGDIMAHQVDDRPDWLIKAIYADQIRFRMGGKVCSVQTDGHGWVEFNVGDWIIKGLKGEIYPCQPDIFAESYEAVT